MDDGSCGNRRIGEGGRGEGDKEKRALSGGGVGSRHIRSEGMWEGGRDEWRRWGW